MQRVFATLAAAFSLAVLFAATVLPATPAHAANTDPIILVHGFAGFGRDEALGIKYWGALDDLETYLNNQGRTTKTAVVGPVSSNWDRAVELYYQIKGGCVDYGANHSSHFGHDRTVPGKCFPGLYPQWSAANPVHLVSHSMGGQTAKMLVQLLEANGAPHEPGLFGGAKSGWVKSVTAISSPLNGTTLTNVVNNDIPFVVELVGGIAALTGISDHNSFIYNFKLEQWDLKRYAGEGFLSYRDRVVDSPIWEHPVARKDLSLWVLSPDGAAEENAWVRTWPNVYYFSFATRATYTGIFSGWEYPTPTMNPLFMPLAYPNIWPLPPGMGNYTRNQPGRMVLDSSWWPNDGIVNTKSMVVPWNASSVAVNWNGTAQKGKWNYMGMPSGLDHLDIIGWSPFWDARGFYLTHANRLRAL